MTNQPPPYAAGPNGQAPFDPTEGIDLRALANRLLRGWYWFALCLGVALAAGFLYLRYTTPVYLVRATLLMREDGSKTGFSENVILEEFGFQPYFDLTGEIQILRSINLMRQVVDSLKLHIQYFREGRISSGELYDQSPLVLSRMYPPEAAYGLTLNIRGHDDDYFVLEKNKNDTLMVRYGAPFSQGNATLTIERRYQVFPHHSYHIVVQSPQATANYYRGALNVSPVSESSKTIALTLADPAPRRAIEILHLLTHFYDQGVVEEKNRMGRQTLNFINERLAFVAEELYAVEGELESFKRDNAVPLDLSETATRYLSEIAQRDQALMEVELRLTLLSNIENIIAQDTARTRFLPVVSEVISPTLGSMLSAYNDKMLEREELMLAATTSNPRARVVMRQLEELEGNILLSIETVRRELEIRAQQLRARIDPVTRKLDAVPTDQRLFVQIMRQQQIKEQLFIFLLQKREETALSLAAQVPNSRIIDPPSGAGQVSPNRQRALTIAGLLGFLIPGFFLTLLELLNNKVLSEQDIRRRSAIPILGCIGLAPRGQSVVVHTESRTAIAEMFRLLRANLNFMAAGAPRQSILVTSAFSGEGKTFVALNLALTYAAAGHHTLLIAADLHKASLNQILLEGKKDEAGLSNYLSGAKTREEIIRPLERHHERLFFVGSGPLPPNPSELLNHQRMKALFETIRQQFEYIVIDTPPIGLVADAFSFAPHVDCTAFIVRQGHTRREDLDIVDNVYRKRQLPNPCVILNAVRLTRSYSYGGRLARYGYGYYEEEKPKRKKWRVL